MLKRCSYRRAPAGNACHTYMEGALYQMQNIFTCIPLRSGKSPLQDNTLSSCTLGGDPKKVSAKSAGEFSWLIVCLCFAITERDTPSAIAVAPPQKNRGAGTVGCTHLWAATQNDTPRSCLDSVTARPPSSYQIKTAYRYKHLPLLHRPSLP